MKSKHGPHPEWDTDGGWNPDRVRREYHQTTWSQLEMVLLQKLADKKGVTIMQVIREAVHLLLVNNGLHPEGTEERQRSAVEYEAEQFVRSERRRLELHGSQSC
jgi:hypothetical protein